MRVIFIFIIITNIFSNDNVTNKSFMDLPVEQMLNEYSRSLEYDTSGRNEKAYAILLLISRYKSYALLEKERAFFEVGLTYKRNKKAKLILFKFLKPSSFHLPKLEELYVHMERINKEIHNLKNKIYLRKVVSKVIVAHKIKSLTLTLKSLAFSETRNLFSTAWLAYSYKTLRQFKKVASLWGEKEKSKKSTRLARANLQYNISLMIKYNNELNEIRLDLKNYMRYLREVE